MLTDDAINTFFSKGLTTIKQNNMIMPKEKFEGNYVQRFFLTTMLKTQLPDKNKAIIFHILKKAQMLNDEYFNTRQLLNEFILSSEINIGQYVKILCRMENIISWQYQIVEAIINLIGKKIYCKNDKSIYDKLDKCYNCIKHLQKDQIGSSDIQKTWIENSGFCTINASLSYAEIWQVMIDIKTVADNLSELKYWNA